MALLGLSDVKGTSYLPNIMSTSTDDDTVLTALLARVSRVIATYCGYAPAAVGGNPTMESTTYTAFRFDVPASAIAAEGEYGGGARGRTRVRLPFGPITAIASVYNDPDLAFPTSSLLDSTDYEVDTSESGSILQLLPLGTWGTWRPGDRAGKITCTAGYATVPDGLVHAAGLLVKHVFELGQRQGKSGTNVGGANEQLRVETMPDVVREALQPFVLPYKLVGP